MNAVLILKGLVVSLIKGLGLYFVRKLLVEVTVDALIEVLGKLKDKTETQVDDIAYEKVKADRDEIVKLIKSGF